MSTFGPEFDEKKDGKRLKTQMKAVRDFMFGRKDWKTLGEIEEATGFPQASISAQLRHLKKDRFGGYNLQKRRRKEGGGTYEYQLREPWPTKQTELFEGAEHGTSKGD